MIRDLLVALATLAVICSPIIAYNLHADAQVCAPSRDVSAIPTVEDVSGRIVRANESERTIRWAGLRGKIVEGLFNSHELRPKIYIDHYYVDRGSTCDPPYSAEDFIQMQQEFAEKGWDLSFGEERRHGWDKSCRWQYVALSPAQTNVKGELLKAAGNGSAK